MEQLFTDILVEVAWVVAAVDRVGIRLDLLDRTTRRFVRGRNFNLDIRRLEV